MNLGKSSSFGHFFSKSAFQSIFSTVDFSSTPLSTFSFSSISVDFSVFGFATNFFSQILSFFQVFCGNCGVFRGKQGGIFCLRRKVIRGDLLIVAKILPSSF